MVNTNFHKSVNTEQKRAGKTEKKVRVGITLNRKGVEDRPS